MTLDHELKALNAKNDSRSEIKRTTLGRELRPLNAKNRALNAKNDSRS